MPLPGIEWDEEKARINLATHQVSFETAQYIFSDSERLERPDRSAGNLSGEERLQTLGMVNEVLFVVYTERGENSRLISARRANKAERRSYNGYYHIDGKSWTKAV
ncbi:MAG: BrnT family toxin [Treponema sp.]|jgi:uncharacterized DUF497 family protein|nr:BrnT family toxin [Treponema sp.]